MKLEEYKAKSEQNGGITFCDHTKSSVNIIATACSELLDINKVKEELPGVVEESLYSGGLHDIGKLTDTLQKYYSGKLKGKNEESTDEDGSDPILSKSTVYRHNILGWAFLRNCTTIARSNDSIHSGILFHHVVPGGEKYGVPYQIISSLSEKDYNVICEAFKFVCNYLYETFGVDGINGVKVELTDAQNTINTIDNECIYPLMIKQLNGKTGSSIKDELDKFSRNFIVRSMTIFGDRLASSMVGDSDRFASNDVELIKEEIYRLTNFSSSFSFMTPDFLESVGYDRSRVDKQFEYARKLITCKNSILQANAGFGKTLLGVIYSVLLGKKTIWVVPTNDPAHSTYLSINKEFEKMGMEKYISTALYYSGDYVYGDEDADILVTNIDTFLGYMIKNNVASKLATLFSSTIIFDEFHELINSTKPLFAAFIGTVYTLMRYTKANVLCMSATAHRLDEYFWNTRQEENYIQYIKADIYGKDTPIRLFFRKYNGVKDLVIGEKDSIVVAETRNDCISYGVCNEDIGYTYMHALFPDTWRGEKLEKMLEKYGKHSTIASRTPMIGTTILGYAVDITTSNMYDFSTSPDTTIQRNGRTGRFGLEGSEVLTYNFCVDMSKASHNIIKNTFNWDLYLKWCDVMENNSGKTLTREEFYKLYDSFIEEHKKEYRDMLTRKFNKSSICLKDMKPYRTFKVKDESNKALPLGCLTYRGNNSSIYVVARTEEGTISEPIIVDKQRIIDKDNEFGPEARKAQFKHFANCIGKDNLKHFYGLSDCEHRAKKSNKGFDEIKFDIARHRNTPLLLTKARFSPNVGLIMDYGKSYEDDDD